jgi:predicted GNAT family N-acyltransferase
MIYIEFDIDRSRNAETTGLILHLQQKRINLTWRILTTQNNSQKFCKQRLQRISVKSGKRQKKNGCVLQVRALFTLQSAQKDKLFAPQQENNCVKRVFYDLMDVKETRTVSKEACLRNRC